MDEQRAMNLERALNEKIYFLNEITRKKSEDEQQLQFLRDEIEKERKKSSADEALVQKLELILK